MQCKKPGLLRKLGLLTHALEWKAASCMPHLPASRYAGICPRLQQVTVILVTESWVLEYFKWYFQNTLKWLTWARRAAGGKFQLFLNISGVMLEIWRFTVFGLLTGFLFSDHTHSTALAVLSFHIPQQSGPSLLSLSAASLIPWWKQLLLWHSAFYTPACGNTS